MTAKPNSTEKKDKTTQALKIGVDIPRTGPALECPLAQKLTETNGNKKADAPVRFMMSLSKI
jgi:hypothetical protein